MPAAVLGLLSAVVYGSADFLGGVAARRIGPVRTTAVGAVSGLLLLLLALPFAGGAWSAAALGWGALSGLAGSVAVGLLYACLAIGPMSILSPLTALVSAVVPMAWGLIGGDRFGAVGYLALGMALVAVVLVGFVPEKGAVRPSARALLMAVGAGAMIGVFLILLDQTPEDSGVVPLIANRAVNGAVMWTLVGVLVLRGRRPARRDGDAPARLEPRGTGIAVAGGALDASANVLILLGLRLGDLTTMSVLVALYPAGTILLAAVVLRERVAPVQWVGLVLAVVAAALLSLT
ncbi:EamA family transporter [Leifsonia soli]|uniref:Drug/metabolite transporter (DMT)-like permease n=1 Tax=Leifsonia soli TaxID=582665 RepID=A0A852SZG6_9MICO|nr:EamA family transporter [Leifsonia soli]NYD74646.1 drug/metabolite transporter (DMT)-like permease [Leifsonia soli]